MAKKIKWFLFEEVQNYPLWIAWSPILAFAKALEKEVGLSLTRGFFITKSGSIYIYFIEDEFKKAGEILLKKVLKKPEFLDVILCDIEKLSEQLLVFSKRINEQKIFNLDDKSLLSIYKRFYAIHKPLWIKGQGVNYLEHGNSLLTKEVKARIKKIIKSREQVEKVFNILTKSEKYSFAQKEEQDLIKLSIKGSSDDDLIKHWKEYCWLGYNWAGPGFNLDYYRDRLNLLVKDKRRKEYLEAEEDRIKRIKKQKSEIIRKNCLSKDILILAKLTEKIVYLKSFRVDACLYGYLSMEKLFKEIGRRLKLSIKQIQYILPYEIEEAILEKKINSDLLNKRRQISGVKFHDGTINLMNGKESAYYLKFFQKQELKKAVNIEELKGECGSPGKARGVVKIINHQKEIGKMKQGNIMVSHTTNPTLILAMKKAKAIIAEVGGITCHAAIVSRELNIPCVIGTKIATKVLKDGDLVEVDANKGIVKIIKKK